MRIIAGRYKGLQISTVSGKQVRPTLDRVRESLFSILAQDLDGAVVLDLFAGSGALGLEAASRGATTVWFVEQNRQVAQALQQNIERVGQIGLQLLQGPVDRALVRLAREGQRFDLIFLDPPYHRSLVARTIAQIDKHNLLADNGRIVAEHEVRLKPPAQIAEFYRFDVRAYGDTALSFYSPMRVEAP